MIYEAEWRQNDGGAAGVGEKFYTVQTRRFAPDSPFSLTVGGGNVEADSKKLIPPWMFNTIRAPPTPSPRANASSGLLKSDRRLEDPPEPHRLEKHLRVFDKILVTLTGVEFDRYNPTSTRIIV